MIKMSLFALSDDPANRIARIPLEAHVQDEVSALFTQQETEFRMKSQREIAFDGKYKPEPEECLYIDSFDDIDGLKVAVTNAASVPAIPPAAANLYNIKALFAGRVDAGGNAVVLLQFFEKRRIISTGGLLTLILDANHYTKFQTIGLTIDDKLSAIFEGKKLSVFSFYVARQIFDLSQHYITATDQDITDFASSPHVQVHDQKKFVENSDTWVRRKIALIKQSGVLDEVPIGDIKKVAAEFEVNIATETKNSFEVIVLPDDKAQLKSLLRFLDEDYYKSSLRALPHLTNSKIRL
jgi:hypothetical protein